MLQLLDVTLARGGIPLFTIAKLTIAAGERILLTGENGTGKSSLLLLLASRIHPFENRGVRSYSWQADADLRTVRRHIALVSREEQLRLSKIHATSSVRDFLLEHGDGEDFLYRPEQARDRELVAEVIDYWDLNPIAERTMQTLSLGEFRLVQLARAAMHPRRLYLLDEVFSSLSGEAIRKVSRWLGELPKKSAVVLISHDEEIRRYFQPTRILHIENQQIHEINELPKVQPGRNLRAQTQEVSKQTLIECSTADFYHDFALVLQGISFTLKSGDRILLTGPNGSGKTTLLRVMHGDFYPAYGAGSLRFVGVLAHEHKSILWQKVQLLTPAQFAYFPAAMRVEEVLSSGLSGSIYNYAPALPQPALAVVQEFGLLNYLPRLFQDLSEGEKTRVLLCRAFLAPATVYLIDEGFMALSQRYLTLVLDYLNHLPAEATVVIAANERLTTLGEQLQFALQRWRMERGRLTILP